MEAQIHHPQPQPDLSSPSPEKRGSHGRQKLSRRKKEGEFQPDFAADRDDLQIPNNRQRNIHQINRIPYLQYTVFPFNQQTQYPQTSTSVCGDASTIPTATVVNSSKHAAAVICLRPKQYAHRKDRPGVKPMNQNSGTMFLNALIKTENEIDPRTMFNGVAEAGIRVQATKKTSLHKRFSPKTD